MVNRLSSTRFSSLETSEQQTQLWDNQCNDLWFLIYPCLFLCLQSCEGLLIFTQENMGGMLVRSHWYRYRYTHTTRTRKIHTPTRVLYVSPSVFYLPSLLSPDGMSRQRLADANSADFIVGTELTPCHQQPHDNHGFIILRPNSFPTILFLHQNHNQCEAASVPKLSSVSTMLIMKALFCLKVRLLWSVFLPRWSVLSMWSPLVRAGTGSTVQFANTTSVCILMITPGSV